IIASLQNLPDTLFEGFTGQGLRRSRLLLRRHGFSDGIGILISKPEQSPVTGNQQGIRATQRLRDYHLRALWKSHGIPCGHSNGLNVASQFNGIASGTVHVYSIIFDYNQPRPASARVFPARLEKLPRKWMADKQSGASSYVP